jgi:hypothetical protein
MIDIVFMAISFIQLIIVILIYRKVKCQQSKIETIIASTELMKRRQNATYYSHLLSLKWAYVKVENYTQAAIVDQAIKSQYGKELEI